MKLLEPFSDAALVRGLTVRIARLAQTRERTVLMEVCGTHTHAIGRWGLRELLPKNVRLVSGPGCPVCVTPGEYIDNACRLALEQGAVIATFGDLMRVPGLETSLEAARGAGADVRTLYSPYDALALAEATDREVVFLAIGFETTSPTVAATVAYARDRSLTNFLIIPAHKLIPPAMAALLEGGDVQVDGFLCPGHVSVTTGSAVFEPLAERYQAPCVVTGFEAEDILDGIAMLLLQMVEGRPTVEIQYKRWVSREGNRKAQARLEEVFDVCDTAWRGLGVIPQSGLGLREELSRFDALSELGIDVPPELENPGCSCGDVLRGVLDPPECPLFAKACTPATPVGPCMVSTEGSCAAFYRYGREA